MGDTGILLDELAAQARAFEAMARRIGVSVEELAEEALRRFPPPAPDSDPGRALQARVGAAAASTGVRPRVVLAAATQPAGRRPVFEAVESAKAFGKRLQARHGGHFSSSLPLIREDRER